MSKFCSRLVYPDLMISVFSYDVMKFSISEISNDDISETGHPIDFVFDSGYPVGVTLTSDRIIEVKQQITTQISIFSATLLALTDTW